MTQDAFLIAKAILELKPEGNVIKDYIFPITMSLFSALVGGWVAIIINAKQDSKKRERENYAHANKLMFTVIECLNTLIAIKLNYLTLKSPDPYQRAFSVPEILINHGEVKFELSDYSFIQAVQTNNFTLLERFQRFIYFKVMKRTPDKPSEDELGKTWRNLSRIGALLSNYNTVLHSIDKRNKLDEVARSALSSLMEGKSIKTQGEFIEAVNSCLSRKDIINLIDLSESIISLVDHLISEMHSFTNDFPLIAESNIELSMVGKGRKIIKIKNERPKYVECLEPISCPDFDNLAEIFGGRLEDIKHRYTYSSWY